MPYKALLVDLDDTVYPISSGLWPIIRDRIGLYMMERMGMAQDVVPSLRARLFSTYGTTFRGLKTEFSINEDDFLAFVHDVPLHEFISPDPCVRTALLKYPLQRAIFTNADDQHALRVLKVLNLQDCFEEIIDIRILNPHCKPQPEAYHIASQKLNVDPACCVMVDDSIDNLITARNLGFYTIRVGSRDNDSRCHASVESLRDLPDVLDSLVME